MDEIEKQGHDEIAKAVRACENNVMVIEQTRAFGDILHSTLVVRHYRATTDRKIVWVIDKRYVETFKYFTVDELGPHVVAPMPDLPPWPADGKYRIAWVKKAGELTGVVEALGVGVHPWGDHGGDIVTAVLHNGKIRPPNLLAVPRRPWLPIVDSDRNWRRAHVKAKTYVALEYRSYSLEAPSIEYYETLVRGIRAPVVALGGSNDPKLQGVIDGRGTTYREAKAVIEDAVVFVGCASGLSCLCASIDNGPYVAEIADRPHTMTNIGYRRNGERHLHMAGVPVGKIAEAINKTLVTEGVGLLPVSVVTAAKKEFSSRLPKRVKPVSSKISVRLRRKAVRIRKKR